MASDEVPFELGFRGEGAWRGYWAVEKVGVEVGGTEQRPTGAMLATLVDVVGRWAEVKQAIAAFVGALAPDHHVPLDPPGNGGFAARSCGFDGQLMFQSISVTDGAAPDRVLVTFYTGYPDGYASYEAVLAGGVPVAISAYAS